MKSLVLKSDDVRALVSDAGLDYLLDRTIDRLRFGLRQARGGGFEAPKRAGFHYRQPAVGLLEWMPGKDAESTTVKVVGYHPHNPSSSLPTILSVVAAFDTSTGALTALADGTFLTALRTGAASAIATDVLAREDCRTLGLIGCGAQAVAQLHALARVRPIDSVLIFDVDKRVEASFEQRIEPLGLQVRVGRPPLEQVVENSDILCTCTSVAPGEGPVFESGPRRPWLHVNAVGSDFPGKVETPSVLLERAFICADFPEQCLLEGECQQVKPSAIAVDLAELSSEPSQFHCRREELTVFDSTGWSLEDHFALDVLVTEAKRRGLGTEMEIDSSSAADPHNPYAFLSAGDSLAEAARSLAGVKKR